MGTRILLADDSITIQKVVNLTFADEGIEVIAVSNGDLAERRLAEVKPDLVLADIFMPGKNGYELCEVIKQNSQFRNVPVVLLVGAFEPFDQGEARRVQADAHLTKPFESRTLVETVRRLISASGRSQAGPIAAVPSPGEGREAADHADPTPVPVSIPAAPKLDLTEMMADHGVSSPAQMRNTGELASSLVDTRATASAVGVQELPVADAVDTQFTIPHEEFDPMELASIDDLPSADMRSSAAQDKPDMILDFDRVESSEASAPQGKISVEADVISTVEAEAVAKAEGAEWLSHVSLDHAAVESIATGAVEVASSDNGHAISSRTPVNGKATDHEFNNEAAFAFSDQSIETGTTMLAVDDPLGDVLDAGPSQMTAVGNELLDIELTEPATTTSSAGEDTNFDLIETAESVDSVQPIGVVEDHIESELELLDTEMVVKTDDAGAQPIELTADSRADFVESDDILDWRSPNASSRTEIQPEIPNIHLDSSATSDIQIPQHQSVSSVNKASQPSHVSMASGSEIPKPQPEAAMGLSDVAESQHHSVPDAVTEPLTQTPAETGVREIHAAEASFEGAGKWHEEEAKFAAIDIEAFPVEEPEAPPQFEAVDTGFSIASIPAQAGIESQSLAAAQPENATNGSSSPASLSSETIDEIVRRVVAEMTESVVREVAWEVVPDCVERVINQLTRESLSRRA